MSHSDLGFRGELAMEVLMGSFLIIRWPSCDLAISTQLSEFIMGLVKQGFLSSIGGICFSLFLSLPVHSIQYLYLSQMTLLLRNDFYSFTAIKHTKIKMHILSFLSYIHSQTHKMFEFAVRAQYKISSVSQQVLQLCCI